MRPLRNLVLQLCVAIPVAVCLGCAARAGGGGAPDGESSPSDVTGPTTRPVLGAAADYTYSLDSSVPTLRLWVTPPCAKVFEDTERSPVPETKRDRVRLFLAGNEFEPFQLVIWAATSGSCMVTLPSFGIGETVTLHSVEYVPVREPSDALGSTGRWPDPLLPRLAGEAIPVSAGHNKPLWFTVYVPEGTPSGEYAGDLVVSVPPVTLRVPVTLHVFAFSLPRAISLKSQVGYSHEALGGTKSLQRVEEIKTFFHSHRLTPEAVAWPARLNYDCGAQTFDDADSGDESFSNLGPTYVDGIGWNGVGFPSFVALKFASDASPRPLEFCGTPLGDDYGTAAYNLKWQQMLRALNAYLTGHGYADKAYYHVMNDPDGQTDYDLACYLAEMSKSVAPDLRLAIAEEPKRELFGHRIYTGARFDIWIADLPLYDQVVQTAWDRQRNHGEEVWWNSRHADAPYPNPSTIDHSGLESRLLGFAAYRFRVDGYAYYDLTRWGDPWTNPRLGDSNGDGFLLYPEPGTASSSDRFIPSIRLELLRDAFEDYEYLLLANGGKPRALDATPLDATAESVVQSLTSWTGSPESFEELRRELGRYIAGERSGIPVLRPDEGMRPRDAYYLNFQDPNGEPSAEPLVIDSKTYMKIGWAPYDAELGYGWRGSGLGTGRTKYVWLDSTAVSPLQRSIIYDESGQQSTFEFDLANGEYDVTVSVGWFMRSIYRHQRVVVEGVPIVDNEGPTGVMDKGYLVRTERVSLNDGRLTFEVGGVLHDNEYQYTMLNYVDVVPAG